MTLSELIESVDILEYISQFTEFEEKNGEYWALSPLKEEETPSFSVNTEINRFYDFSSGKGGNILSFIKSYYHCGDSKAADILRKYAGEKGCVSSRQKMAASKIAKKFAPKKKHIKTSKSVALPDNYMSRYQFREDKLQIWKDEGISVDVLRRFQVAYHKKSAIEAAGLKYIHAVEAYLTSDLSEKIRDNYHCVLLAKNYDGFLELNQLVSDSFNRKDNHFYYVPRISFDELFQTSDNILITTACIGGVLAKGDGFIQERFLNFMKKNKHRCYFEIGHHLDEKQVIYNQRLEDRVKQYILSRSKLTSEEYDSKLRVEWYMFSDEAKEKGFVDYIIGKDCDIDEII